MLSVNAKRTVAVASLGTGVLLIVGQMLCSAAQPGSPTTRPASAPAAPASRPTTDSQPATRPYKPAATRPGTLGFDDHPVDAPPPGWTFTETNPGPQPGTWLVVADPNAPSSPNVLRLQTREPSKTFNLAIFDSLQETDTDIRARVRADSGQDDQGGGVLWRYRDENNYYVCRLNPLEGNFRVYKVVDGQRTQLQSADFGSKAGQWYDLRIVMFGSQIVCSVNGKPLLNVTDGTFPNAGRVGLWTKADASSSFDDFSAISQTAAPASKPTTRAAAPTTRPQP